MSVRRLLVYRRRLYAARARIVAWRNGQSWPAWLAAEATFLTVAVGVTSAVAGAEVAGMVLMSTLAVSAIEAGMRQRLGTA